MAVKVLRGPVVLVVATAVAFGAYATVTRQRADDRREVVFWANWRPQFVKAGNIRFGTDKSAENRRSITAQFREVRWLNSGDIAVLDVELPLFESISEASCSVKVAGEAPKFGDVSGDRRHCSVEKYVP